MRWESANGHVRSSMELNVACLSMVQGRLMDYGEVDSFHMCKVNMLDVVACENKNN